MTGDRWLWYPPNGDAPLPLSDAMVAALDTVATVFGREVRAELYRRLPDGAWRLLPQRTGCTPRHLGAGMVRELARGLFGADWRAGPPRATAGRQGPGKKPPQNPAP